MATSGIGAVAVTQAPGVHLWAGALRPLLAVALNYRPAARLATFQRISLLMLVSQRRQSAGALLLRLLVARQARGREVLLLLI